MVRTRSGVTHARGDAVPTVAKRGVPSVSVLNLAALCAGRTVLTADSARVRRDGSTGASPKSVLSVSMNYCGTQWWSL